MRLWEVVLNDGVHEEGCTYYIKAANALAALESSLKAWKKSQPVDPSCVAIRQLRGTFLIPPKESSK